MLGKLIIRKYVAESATTDCREFWPYRPLSTDKVKRPACNHYFFTDSAMNYCNPLYQNVAMSLYNIIWVLFSCNFDWVVVQTWHMYACYCLYKLSWVNPQTMFTTMSLPCRLVVNYWCMQWVHWLLLSDYANCILIVAISAWSGEGA